MESFILKQLRRLPGCLICFLLMPSWFSVSCRRNEIQPLVTSAADSIALKARTAKAFRSIRILEKKIQTGDMVTRTGNDFTSQSLRKLNRRDATFSHCGIASVENDTLFIYHAIGGEWNPTAKLKREPWILFAEPYSNNAIGHFRFRLDDYTRRKLVRKVQAFYSEALPFDMDFDLATDDRMYCAEFVAKSITIASNTEIVFPVSHINKFSFIGVDDLFLHPACEKMEEVLYK